MQFSGEPFYVFMALFKCPSYIIIDQRTDQCIIADETTSRVFLDSELRVVGCFGLPSELSEGPFRPRLALAGDRVLSFRKNDVKVYRLQ